MAFAYEDLTPGDFTPSSIDGGLQKLVRIWEYLRSINTGGYGSGILTELNGIAHASGKHVTSCSPFTATVVAMALDPRPVDVGQEYSLAGPYNPQFDGGKPLTSSFYGMHNSFEASTYLTAANGMYTGWKAGFKKAYVDHLPQLQAIKFPISPRDLNHTAFQFVNDSAGSLVAHGLAVAVKPGQMRRGDMVGINWADNGGHATFCWNVHLNKTGEVDAFQFISSNGTSAGGGVGVSLFRYPDIDPKFVKKSGATYSRTGEPMFSAIVQDPTGHGEYHKGPYYWFGMPGFKKGDIDLTTFGCDKSEVWVDYAMSKPCSIQSVMVARLNGVQPPDPYLRADGKQASASPTPPPPPVAKVTSKPADPPPPATPDAPSTPAAPDSQASKDKPPPTDPGDAQAFQMVVENALKQLWTARWIDKDPGDSTQVNDPASQAAIADYQKKFMGGDVPSLGHADPATRKRMINAGAYAAMMPMVNVALKSLAQNGKISKAPGDNLPQLDAATRASVTEFQKKNGLGADGIPGEHTQKSLFAAIKDLPPQASPIPPPATPQSSAPAASNAGAPATAPAAIYYIYWAANHGTAGSTVPLKVVASPTCNGKTYSIGLYQGDKAVTADAGKVTIANSLGSLDVSMPSSLSPGATLVAKLTGGGLTAATASPFTIDAAGAAASAPANAKPASAGMIASGGIKVAGKSFPDWFNTVFQPGYKGKTSPDLVKGVHVDAFPNKVNADNFKKFFDQIKALTGLDEITLLQFTAAFSIPYNESGGSFRSSAEKGGGAALPRHAAKTTLINFGEVGYFFWGIQNIKSSYNSPKDGWTTPAGDHLLAKGLITQDQVKVWNGRPSFTLDKDDNWKKRDPLNEPQNYPNPQEEPLKSAQKDCDFYKYRGRGLTQTTGAEGYKRFADPALVAAGHKKVADLTNDELDALMMDPAVYVGVFRQEFQFNSKSSKGFAAITDDAQLVGIGDKFSGVGVGYGNFYRWRCMELKKAMEDAGFTGG